MFDAVFNDGFSNDVDGGRLRMVVRLSAAVKAMRGDYALIICPAKLVSSHLDGSSEDIGLRQMLRYWIVSVEESAGVWVIELECGGKIAIKPESSVRKGAVSDY